MYLQLPHFVTSRSRHDTTRHDTYASPLGSLDVRRSRPRADLPYSTATAAVRSHIIDDARKTPPIPTKTMKPAGIVKGMIARIRA